MDECAKQQIDKPIVPGIMPIMEFGKLKRFSDLCGAEVPRWLYKRLESYSDDIESIRQFGVEMVTTMCERLVKGGAPGLHFYTLNRAEEASSIINNLRLADFYHFTPSITTEVT